MMRRPGLAENVLMECVVSRGVKELVILAEGNGREIKEMGQQ